MINYLKAASMDTISGLDWMDKQTKDRMILKAQEMTYKMGYPSQLFNDTWMEEKWNYVKQPTHTEPLLDYAIRIKTVRTTKELSRYQQLPDKSRWHQSPVEVDAFYAPNLNEMSKQQTFIGKESFSFSRWNNAVPTSIHGDS
jgi:predicted metalloendopeptidase